MQGLGSELCKHITDKVINYVKGENKELEMYRALAKLSDVRISCCQVCSLPYNANLEDVCAYVDCYVILECPDCVGKNNDMRSCSGCAGNYCNSHEDALESTDCCLDKLCYHCLNRCYICNANICPKHSTGPNYYEYKCPTCIRGVP